MIVHGFRYLRTYVHADVCSYVNFSHACDIFPFFFWLNKPCVIIIQFFSNEYFILYRHLTSLNLET